MNDNCIDALPVSEGPTRLSTFFWLGQEFVMDGDNVPSPVVLARLPSSIGPEIIDALIWDDVAVDFYPRHRRLRMVRSHAPLSDSRLQEQIRGPGRVAVKASRWEQLVDSGAVQKSDGPTGMFLWLSQSDPSVIATLPGHYRFVGPAFERRVEAPISSMAPAQARSISVVLNYRDHADVTIACLQHLSRQLLTADLEVIVVDNRSTESERRRVDECLNTLFGVPEENTLSAIRFVHLRFDAPFNLSYQNNFAAAQATSEVIVLLNNDCYLLDPNCLQILSNWALVPGVATASPRMVGIGGRLVTAGVSSGVDVATGKPRLWECEYVALSHSVRWTAANSTACAAINRDAWFEVGGMDACFFPSQYDDADLCLRMASRGWRHLYVGSVGVFHEPGTTEERKKVEIARLMEALLDRHSLEQVAGSAPDFEVLQKMPKLSNDDARVWTEFVTSFQSFIGWTKQSHRGATAEEHAVLEAWTKLQQLSDSPRGVPTASAMAELWYRQHQCVLMLQCVVVCRRYLKLRAEPAGFVGDALAAIEERLQHELAASASTEA